MNRHRAYWSAMGSSIFEFENNLDERHRERKKIIKEFTEKVISDYKACVMEYADKSDTVSIDGLIREGIRALVDEFK
ncbi:hypothetical protein [Bacillus smithii]|uniref:hypothetical protein n=1 Tax=Bacillus smithii TaxID=1479 RepID=UPI003D20D562